MKGLIILLLFLNINFSKSQTVIWIEDFQSYSVHPTQIGSDNNLPIGPDWTTSWVDCDDGAAGISASTYSQAYWGTRLSGANVEFLCNDIEGGPCTCANGGGTTDNIITTELIDISSYTNIYVSLKHRYTGTLECTPLATCDNEYDRIELMYSVDGGSYNSIALVCATNGTMGNCIVGGNNLRLKIAMGNKANNEYFFIDSLMVVGSSQNCIVLPVDIIEFKAKQSANGNSIEWKIETDNKTHFIIEKSSDGIYFNDTNTVEYEPDYIYSIIDSNPYPITYYRLKIIDTDIRYSNIITVYTKTNPVKILKIINYMGYPVDESYQGLKIYFMDDGSVIKKINPQNN